MLLVTKIVKKICSYFDVRLPAHCPVIFLCLCREMTFSLTQTTNISAWQQFKMG